MTESLLTAGVGNEGSPETTEPSPPTGTDPIGRRPDGVPEKFWDESAGQVRTEALLKSYLELERKLSGARGRDIPDAPEKYTIDIKNEVLSVDPEINRTLHEAGFSQEQAQLVYDLAAERLMPLVSEIAAVYEAEGQVTRLVQHFGGEDQWREASRQIATWGKKHLPERVFDALSTTCDGVLAMHRMMAGDEPELVRNAMPADPLPTEADLKQLMRDPRYWQRQDPQIVRHVREGFRRLYPDRG